MSPAPLARIAGYLDTFLRVNEISDYPNALNGIQLENRREIAHVAAAVDVSRSIVDDVVKRGADLLLVHHGMFWGGLQALRGPAYERTRRLIDGDVAVYSAHLPLDAHPEVGNNVLLARELELTPNGGFATSRGTAIGVRGEDPIATSVLVDRARVFARRHGGDARVTAMEPSRLTRRWAICTGGGPSPDTLAEATALGIDTLIVGEGPHWTAVEAPDVGLVIIYAGHYATETLGVRALAEHIAERFELRCSFIESPTGL